MVARAVALGCTVHCGALLDERVQQGFSILLTVGIIAGCVFVRCTNKALRAIGVPDQLQS